MDDATEQPIPKERDSQLLEHLIELRRRLLYCLASIFTLTIPLVYFSNPLYQILAQPLLVHLPKGSHLIATGIAAPFLTPLKLSVALAFFLSVPILLYHLWAFVTPGLYQKEKKYIVPLLISSIFLFYLGMAFAYYIVFPLVFGFLSKAAPAVVTVMPDMSHYFDFTLTLFFAFGAAFEVPIATLLLIKTGISTRQSLAAKRPYVIVGAFVIGMLLTPPDVISQILLALPIWLLFELGLLLSWVGERR